MISSQISHDGDVYVLSVQGHLDPQNGNELKEAIDGIFAEKDGPLLVIDLAELAYMASAGFRVLFMAGRRIERAGGRLVVSSLQGEVKRVFELAGFDTAYQVFPDRESAVAALKG